MSSRGQPVKLSLNREALERLLGGDTQLEIDLRYQVVKEFSKRHLKEVVESPLYAKTLREITAILDQEIKEQVGTTTYSIVWQDIPTIKGTVKELIEGAVQKAIRDVVTELVNDAAEKRREEWKGYIDRKAKALFDQDIQTLVKDEFKKILEKMK